jgi:hypothetical protein
MFQSIRVPHIHKHGLVGNGAYRECTVSAVGRAVVILYLLPSITNS